MFGSFQIGRVLGIPVRVHGLLLLLVGILSALSPHPGQTLLALALLFAVVGLHELGHCLVARRYGARVFDITFWPLGGMARMSDIPEDSRAETAIALAGPGVNFALALGAGAALALLMLVLPPVEVTAIIDPGAWRAETTAQSLGSHLVAAVEWFIAINLALGIFNLVPAFPMDGGRVLRAQLGRRGDWVDATEKAVRVGRLLAAGMVVAGLLWQQFVLIAIAGFVWLAGTRELWSVRLRHSQLSFGPFGVRGASWSPSGAGFRSPDFEPDPLGTGEGTGDRDTSAGAGGPMDPGGDGRNGDWSDEDAPSETPPESGARRPDGPWGVPGWGSGPWTEDRIRALENFRGRLRRDDA